MERENSVKSLKTTPFERRTLQEKLRVKELGPDRQNVLIRQQSEDRRRRYTRCFSRSWYEKTSWLTGCSEAVALFCFPCLLFQTKGTDQAWIQTGMAHLKHFSDKVKRHEQARSHMENAMRLGMLSRANIAVQLDDSYRIGIHKHKEEVGKNRHILSKIIDCRQPVPRGSAQHHLGRLSNAEQGQAEN